MSIARFWQGKSEDGSPRKLLVEGEWIRHGHGSGFRRFHLYLITGTKRVHVTDHDGGADSLRILLRQRGYWPSDEQPPESTETKEPNA